MWSALLKLNKKRISKNLYTSLTSAMRKERSCAPTNSTKDISDRNWCATIIVCCQCSTSIFPNAFRASLKSFQTTIMWFRWSEKSDWLTKNLTKEWMKWQRGCLHYVWRKASEWVFTLRIWQTGHWFSTRLVVQIWCLSMWTLLLGSLSWSIASIKSV